jgi:acetyl esterase/lipase
MFRLVLSILFLLISSLAVLKAPTNLLWQLSIAVTEWGHIFAIIIIMSLLFPWWNTDMGKLSAVISSVALMLSLSPIVRALMIEGRTEKAIAQTFGTTDNKDFRPKALVLSELFTGIKNPAVAYKNIVYAIYPDRDVTLDFYPTKVKNAPCVIVVHGGGWYSGDSQQLAPLNSYLAARGYAVVAINYRLAPKYQYSQQIEDVHNAVAYVKAHAEELGIDSTNLVLLGRSAGAQLVLQAAYTVTDKDIKGVVSFYAPADMVWGYSLPCNKLIMDSRKVLDEYIGVSCFVDESKYTAASPIEHITADAPPTLLLHGEPDVMVAFEQRRRLNEKLNKLGVKHLLVDLPWATHGYDFNFSGPGSQISTYAIERFFASVTRK